MDRTLVAVFESNVEAQKAQQALWQAGFSQSDVTMQSSGATQDSSMGTARSHDGDEGGVSKFFHSFFGNSDDRRSSEYSEAARRGNCMLTVHAQSDDQAEEAADILDDCDAIDIDERAAQWRNEGWQAPVASKSPVANKPPAANKPLGRDGASMTPSADTQKLSVMQEELQIGKRSVERGGVRVFTRVTETPVEETVNLRDETISVERHPVNRAATQEDLAAMKDGTIELRETDEEAVVSKVSKVTEEIEIGKKVTDREQKIRDTVRHTDVEVENLGAEADSKASRQSKPPTRPM